MRYPMNNVGGINHDYSPSLFISTACSAISGPDVRYVNTVTWLAGTDALEYASGSSRWHRIRDGLVFESGTPD